MTLPVNAILIFCEGPHDVAYLRLIFKKIMGYKVEKLKFSELPSPFNSLFKGAIVKHSAQDMSLDMAHKFFLPDTILSCDDSYVFIFNTGGKDQHAKIQVLLADLIPMMEIASVFPEGAEFVVGTLKYLFLYDSDAIGIERIAFDVSNNFNKIGDIDFLTQPWAESASRFGRVSENKAVFVWGAVPEMGTLEDIVLPICERSSVDNIDFSEIKNNLTSMFTWDIAHAEKATAVAEIQRLNKAIITVAGQRKKPGSSMSVILEQSGLIDVDVLNSCQRSSDFVQFARVFFAV